jgi:hypothetical protein
MGSANDVCMGIFLVVGVITLLFYIFWWWTKDDPAIWGGD